MFIDDIADKVPNSIDSYDLSPEKVFEACSHFIQSRLFAYLDDLAKNKDPDLERKIEAQVIKIYKLIPLLPELLGIWSDEGEEKDETEKESAALTQSLKDYYLTSE